MLKPHEPVYQAIWVDNMDFDEVLISPAMIQDHMPDTVLAALNKVSPHSKMNRDNNDNKINKYYSLVQYVAFDYFQLKFT